MPDKLTEHLNLHEFACPCGCKMPDEVEQNLYKHAQYLERGWRMLGKMVIKSGYRCAAHNKKIGGKPGSLHIQGLAADFKIVDPLNAKRFLSGRQLLGWGEAMIYHKAIREGGLGVYRAYPDLIHYDSRGSKARWVD